MPSGWCQLSAGCQFLSLYRIVWSLQQLLASAEWASLPNWPWRKYSVSFLDFEVIWYPFYIIPLLGTIKSAHPDLKRRVLQSCKKSLRDGRYSAAVIATCHPALCSRRRGQRSWNHWFLSVRSQPLEMLGSTLSNSNILRMEEGWLSQHFLSCEVGMNARKTIVFSQHCPENYCILDVFVPS